MYFNWEKKYMLENPTPIAACVKITNSQFTSL